MSIAPQGNFCQERSYALRAACVPPTKNPSPVARIFGVSRKKLPKTPFETKVSKLPLRGYTSLMSVLSTSRTGMRTLRGKDRN